MLVPAMPPLSRCLFAFTLGAPFLLFMFGGDAGSGGGGRVLGVGPTDLQEALNAARSGDVILLDPGARYVGNFVRRRKRAMHTSPFRQRSIRGG
jgi:hypothetical protein